MINMKVPTDETGSVNNTFHYSNTSLSLDVTAAVIYLKLHLPISWEIHQLCLHVLVAFSLGKIFFEGSQICNTTIYGYTLHLTLSPKVHSTSIS